MATAYKITITMTGDTVTTLQTNGYSLYGFRVVSASKGAKPVAWFKGDIFELTNTLAWDEQYEAYTSRNEVASGVKIDTSASYPIDMAEILEVNNPMGIGEVSHTGGTEGAICILNKTNQPLTCGISQPAPQGGGTNPICAFPLLGTNMDEIVPVEKIFLMFSAKQIDTGVVVEKAFGPGVLIDLTGVDSRAVKYDANAGWSWDGDAGWATVHTATQNLVPLVIQPSA